MVPWARSKFGASMLEPEVFLKEMYCNEERTCEIVGTFPRPPQSFGTPQSFGVPIVNCASLLPSLCP